MANAFALLRLLQLCNSSLPVGAYSYSEGLETLCEQGQITQVDQLEHWLKAELHHGSIRTELAVMMRAYRAWQTQDHENLKYWNHWYTATRETEELRLQSLQMGRSLIKLLADLELPDIPLDPRHCNYCVAFGIGAAHSQISLDDAALGYGQSWVANLVNAGVKLIPLGQTQGQQAIANLSDPIQQAVQQVLVWKDDDIESNSWGLQLASMTHETLYSRIFRS